MKALSLTIVIAALIAIPAHAQQVGGPNPGVGANVTLNPAAVDRATRLRIGCRIGTVSPKVCAGLAAGEIRKSR
jgi:hypothetical protein